MQVVFSILAVLSVAALIFFFKKSPQQTVALAPILVGLLSLLFTVYGVFKSGKNRGSGGREQQRKAQTGTNQFSLAPSFKSAFFGGLIGGGAAGLLNGVVYYLTSQNPGEGFEAATWDSILWVFVFAVVTGGIFGACCQFLILRLRHALRHSIVSDLVGGMLGGLITGAVMGLWAGWFFGEGNTPPQNNLLVFWGGILCGMFVVLGALLYEHKERERTLKRTLIVLAPATIIVGAIGILVLTIGFDKDYFVGGGLKEELVRGLVFGTFVGALWGLQLGLTHFLYRMVFKKEAQLAPKN